MFCASFGIATNWGAVVDRHRAAFELRPAMEVLPDRRAEAKDLLRGSIVAMADCVTWVGQLAMVRSGEVEGRQGGDASFLSSRLPLQRSRPG